MLRSLVGSEMCIRDRLRGIYANAGSEEAARHLFERWCRLADDTGLPEMRSMAKQVREHIKGILGYWTFAGASNASTEGFNNKIRWLISQAYGFHDYEYFRLKVFDLPSTNIKKCL